MFPTIKEISIFTVVQQTTQHLSTCVVLLTPTLSICSKLQKVNLNLQTSQPLSILTFSAGHDSTERRINSVGTMHRRNWNCEGNSLLNSKESNYNKNSNR